VVKIGSGGTRCRPLAMAESKKFKRIFDEHLEYYLQSDSHQSLKMKAFHGAVHVRTVRIYFDGDGNIGWGGRAVHPSPSPARADFSIMMGCTPEIGNRHCVCTLRAGQPGEWPSIVRQMAISSGGTCKWPSAVARFAGWPLALARLAVWQSAVAILAGYPSAVAILAGYPVRHDGITSPDGRRD
jgi:hypothetical protein